MENFRYYKSAILKPFIINGRFFFAGQRWFKKFSNRGQTVLEYAVLVAVLLAFLVFVAGSFFDNAKNSSEELFIKAMNRITQ